MASKLLEEVHVDYVVDLDVAGHIRLVELYDLGVDEFLVVLFQVFLVFFQLGLYAVFGGGGLSHFQSDVV